MNKTSPLNSDTLSHIDKSSHLHPFTSIKDLNNNGALVMEAAKGCMICDHDGKEYFDAASGLWCVNVGYGQKEISKAIYEQSCKLAYYHSFNATSNEPSAILAKRLIEKAPQNIKRVFYGSSGSDANDTAIKILWSYNIMRGKPEKKKIISRHYAYHGVTAAGGSLSAIPMGHQYSGLPLDFARHVSKPDMYRDAAAQGCNSEEEYSAYLVEELEDMIIAEGPETIAGFFAEPVMGTGGVLPPPKGYFQSIKKVLDKYDICMVADEVITGFGRTGAWFASDKYNMQADLILTAKGLTSGYLPLSAVMVGERIWSVLEEASADGRPFAHGFTYSGHPVCTAAALANLDILERENLVGKVADISTYFRTAITGQLQDIDIVGDIRSVGLMMGIELVSDKSSKSSFPTTAKAAARVALHARENGFLVRALPNSEIIALSPPFIVTHEEIDKLAATLKSSITAVMQQLAQEGLTGKG